MTPPSNIDDSYGAFYQQRNPEHVYPVEFVVRAFLGNYPGHKTDKSSYPGQRVLDVGFGDGRNMPLLDNLGMQVFGYGNLAGDLRPHTGADESSRRRRRSESRAQPQPALVRRLLRYGAGLPCLLLHRSRHAFFRQSSRDRARAETRRLVRVFRADRDQLHPARRKRPRRRAHGDRRRSLWRAQRICPEEIRYRGGNPRARCRRRSPISKSARAATISGVSRSTSGSSCAKRLA